MANLADIILFIIDANRKVADQIKEIDNIKIKDKSKLLIVVNKIDLNHNIKNKIKESIYISAKENKGISLLKKKLLNFVSTKDISNHEIIVTNLRHYEELKLTFREINSILDGLKQDITSDLLAINTRQALFHLGSITGEVTTDTLLGNIFGKFCIGK